LAQLSARHFPSTVGRHGQSRGVQGCLIPFTAPEQIFGFAHPALPVEQGGPLDLDLGLYQGLLGFFQLASRFMAFAAEPRSGGEILSLTRVPGGEIGVLTKTRKKMRMAAMAATIQSMGRVYAVACR
jgi:hypothetical protein